MGALYGQPHPIIPKVIPSTINTTGLNLGSTIAEEWANAKLICSRFSLGKVRFCHSGNEGNLHALAAVRRVIEKRNVAVFTGGHP